MIGEKLRVQWKVRAHLLGLKCAQASMEAWGALSLQRGYSQVCTQESSHLGFFSLKYGGLTFTFGWALHVQSLMSRASPIWPYTPGTLF